MDPRRKSHGRHSMNEDYIRQILDQVSEGRLSSGAAYEALKDLPYKEMGFANVDHHRTMRTGFPEVIFGQGKKPEQIRDIFLELAGHGQTIMATRCGQEDYDVVREGLPQAVFYREAGIIAVPAETPEGSGPETVETEPDADGKVNRPRKQGGEQDSALGTVCVLSAGTADIPVAEEAATTAQLLGNEVLRVYDVGVAGIHRLFDKLPIIRRADVVITVAGMEGALASVIGGLVEVPVIAVPTSVGYGANLGGLSALLSMLNSCANGVCVVNIDNGFGAAYMASVINRGHRKNEWQK